MSRCSGSPGTAPRTRARRARGRDGDGRGHRGGAGHAIATMTSVSGSAVGETPVVLISTLNQDGPDRPHDRQRPDPHWAARIAARYPIYGQGVSAAVPARRPTEPRKLTQIRDAGVRPGRQCLDASWVTAGIDLALALVEEDLGPAIALGVGRELVVFLKRPGGQSQFSSALSAQQATRPALGELHADGRAPERRDCGRARGAREHGRALFARHFGARWARRQPPHARALRIGHARALLEDAERGLRAVAHSAGFGSAEVLRRAFHRRVGVSPADYPRASGAMKELVIMSVSFVEYWWGIW